MQNVNFLKENNARHMFHPMAHPAGNLANPPKFITGGSGVNIIDVGGKETICAVGGLWMPALPRYKQSSYKRPVLKR